MISGAGELRVGDYTPITGIGVFIPIAVNPSNQEYTNLTGKEMPYELNYDKYDTDRNGQTVSAKPVRILGYNPTEDVYEFIGFTLINVPVTSQSGKVRFVNKIGQFSYYATDANEIINNPSVTKWYNTEMLEPLRIGEESYYTFIQRLIRYNSSAPDAKFVVDMKNNGADFDTVYNGDISGLRKLIEWSKAQNHSIGVLYSVREREKDGKIYNVQNIENAPTCFFLTTVQDDGTAVVSPSAEKRLKDYVSERESAGYTAIKNYFTYNLQRYKKEDCVNYVATPEDVVSQSPSTPGIGTW